jgi:hypothetical protein
LLRDRRLWLYSLLSSAALRHSIPQHRERHYHEQPLHPAGFFDTQRRDKNQRVLAKPEAALGMALRFVGRDDCASAPVPRVTIGATDRASGVLLVGLQGCLLGSDLGLPRPCHGLARRLCPWPPLTRLALVVAQMVRVALRRAPRLTPRRQSGGRGGRGLTAFGLPVQAWLLERFACTLLCLGDALLGPFAGRLSAHDQPTLGDAVVPQGHGRITSPRAHLMPQRALERWAADLCHPLAGGGKPREQAALGKLTGPVLAVEFGLGDQLPWCCAACKSRSEGLRPLLAKLAL